MPEAARILNARGANVNARDSDGSTALIFAADGGRYPSLDEESPGVLNLLINKGVDVNASNKDGTTALMVAAEHMRPALVRILLRNGARVNQRNRGGETVLGLVRESPCQDCLTGITLNIAK